MSEQSNVKVAVSSDHHPRGAVSTDTQLTVARARARSKLFPEDLSRYLQIPDEELNAVEEETGLCRLLPF